MVRYPIAIEPGPKGRRSASSFPICPDVSRLAYTLDEAMTGVKEAAAAWIDAALDSGEAIPVPSSLDALQADAAYAGWTFALSAWIPGCLMTRSNA